MTNDHHFIKLLFSINCILTDFSELYTSFWGSLKKVEIEFLKTDFLNFVYNTTQLLNHVELRNSGCLQKNRAQKDKI